MVYEQDQIKAIKNSNISTILHGSFDINDFEEYENDFVISVFNNGNSADKKKIEDHLKGEKNQRAVTGIGLYNVNSRLKLLYGESYGLIYNEKVRNGFEIWVRLPKKITESEER